MSKNFKKILCVILSMVLILGSLPISSLAADSKAGMGKLIAADDVVIKASTDKSKYQTDEEITIKLTVTNKSSKKYDNIGINMAFNGFKFDSEKGSDIIIGELNPGETKTAEFNVNYVKLSLTQRFIFRIVMGFNWMLRNIWGFSSETVRKYVKVGEVKYLFVFCAYEAEGEEEPKPEAEEYTVSFDLNYDGAEDIADQTVVDGECAQEPAEPTRDGYKFIGWYAENSDEKYDFTAAVTSDITLYAKWIEESGEEYTVSFESNGGSSVESQVVAEGDTAEEPETPIKTGYRFLAWYSDADLTVPFSFSTPILSNITLYAKWDEVEEHDSFLDEPEPDVEIYSFNADMFDVLINTTTSVTFTAEIFAEIELGNQDVAVIDDNNSTIGYMNDLGENGDAVACDGIYTLKTDLTSDEIGLVDYYALAAGVKSDSFSICFYREIEDEEFDKFYQIIDAITAMTNIDDVLSYLAQCNEIENYTASEDKTSVSYTLKSGLSGVWEAESEDDYKGKKAAEKISGENAIKTAQTRSIVTDSQFNVGSDVIAVRPFRGSQFTYDDFKDVGTTLSQGLNGNIVVSDDANANLNTFKSFDDYGIVLIDSHGTLYRDTPYMLTGEAAPRNQDSADWVAERLIVAGSRVCVGGGFFDKYYSSGSLDNTVLFLGTCYSLYDNSIANALIRKGAEAVYGYVNPVSVGYCNDTLHETMTVQMLQNRKTVSEAYDEAIEKYGTTSADFQWRGTGSFDLYADGGAIAGSVKSAETSNGISNALIRVYDVYGNIVATTRTDSNGSYLINIAAGNYYVKVSAGSFRSVRMEVVVTENHTTYNETFLLVKSNRLTTANGIISNSITGVAVPDVTINLRANWNNKTGTVLYSTSTNENGYYEIEFNSGAYTMEYYKTGYITGYKNIVVLGTLEEQNALISPVTSDDTYRAVLSWGENPSDLDSHLFGKNADGSTYHVYYSDKNGYNYNDDLMANLDVDDTTSYGPETTTFFVDPNGVYEYYIDWYSGSGTWRLSEGNIAVYKGSELIYTCHVPDNDTQEGSWKVFTIDHGVFTSYNIIQSEDIYND